MKIKLSIPAPRPVRQFMLLTRHFFNRLFQNDLVDFSDQMVERLAGILVILGFFSFMLSFGFLNKYIYVPDMGTSWIEKCALMVFFMLVMGFVAILEWENMYPDARDFANLATLPVKTGVILASKAASLTLFAGLFAVSFNALSMWMFSFILSGYKTSIPFYILIYALYHTIAMSAAVFFSFFMNIFIIGLLMTLFGSRLFSRLSNFIRVIYLTAHVSLLLLYVRILLYGPTKIPFISDLVSDRIDLSRYYNLLPPLWFTDLYETITGNTSLPFHGTYRLALISLIALPLLFFLVMGIRYRSHLNRSETSRRRAGRVTRVRDAFASLFHVLLLRSSIQRAVFDFYRSVLKSSMVHKMRLASFFAIGLGVVPFHIVLRNLGKETLSGLNRTMAALPLILAFFLILGLRGIIKIPVRLKANWIFRITEAEKRRHYMTALRKALFMLNIFPLFVFFFILFSFLWGPRAALPHCIFGLAVTLLIMEILLLQNLKIPFACSFLPGKERLQLYWIPYLLGFLVGLRLLIRLEYELLKTA